MKTYSTIVLTIAVALPAVAWGDDRSAAANKPVEPTRYESAKIEPANQGISPRDLVTTRDINQLIAYSNTLSPTGHEVRVNTYKGRVTLRGFVESSDERQQIEKLAVSVAGSGNIRDEIRIRAIAGKN